MTQELGLRVRIPLEQNCILYVFALSTSDMLIMSEGSLNSHMASTSDVNCGMKEMQP
jgi:hypothetical protein